MAEPKTVAQLVAEAKARIENLTPAEVRDEVARGAVLVDLREPGERTASGVIPGAVHVPRGMLEWRADPTSSYHEPALDPSKRIVLHCAGGGRSALAVETLRAMGYGNVAHLDGGFGAWAQQGLPTEPATD